MKYINMFKTTLDFLNFKENEMTDDAYVNYVEETNNVNLKPYIIPSFPASAGDVAYWDGSKVKTTPLRYWNTSLGKAIGVVVVPEGFAPDGKVRIINLKAINEYGNQSSSHVNINWGYNNTSLIDYTVVPITDNDGSASTGSNTIGYLPSDNFTGATSFVDPKAKYYGNTPYIPSPYLGDSPNPEYYKTIEGDNVLSDFNGLSNTETLVGLNPTGNTAANAAWKYNDGSSNLQWYLPGMGELGYITPRLNEINATISALGGLTIDSNNFFSSSECRVGIYSLSPYVGGIFRRSLPVVMPVRPFALIESKPLEKPSLYEWVDLGLPSGLKWAAWNVGATKPEESGLYFQWGETQGYTGITNEKKFSWADYTLCNGNEYSILKYNNIDGLTTLEAADDAVISTDSSCRMPTYTECQELTANTTSEWVVDYNGTGVAGRIFTSKVNGNSIFIPASGHYREGYARDVGEYGYLWSRSLLNSYSTIEYACALYFGSGYMNVRYSDARYCGYPIRAVKE